MKAGIAWSGVYGVKSIDGTRGCQYSRAYQVSAFIEVSEQCS